MCGIFVLLNHPTYSTYWDDNSHALISNEFNKGKNRGPENSKLVNLNNNTIFGFHRLAINGLDEVSNQPIRIENCVLICNGEIYNYKYLFESLRVKPNTNSDCEIIIHLYLRYGIEQTLIMLDGVFSFALYDKHSCTMHVARDPYGVRPLFLYHDSEKIAFASDVKCLSNLFPILNVYQTLTSYDSYIIKQFTPGTLNSFKMSPQGKWCFDLSYQYFKPCDTYNLIPSNSYDKQNIYQNISKYLNLAVIKRCQTTERPIACLLSGGLDSSLITALVTNYMKKNGCVTPLETYSIGLAGSTDLKFARIVADYIGTNHTEVVVTEQEMFNSIPYVIYAIESYDTTTIRASIGNFLIAKYISQNSEAKVVFNGDGSDELFGGYLYMNKCPDDIEFDKETRRLLNNIHFYDVLRSDKSISSNGLEPRTPFLDKTFVNYTLSIPIHFRNHNNNKPSTQCEKYLLRKSFTSDNFVSFTGKQLIPDEVLWRTKEAFSDGVSATEHSLFAILQSHIQDYYKSIHLLTFNNLDEFNVAFPCNLQTEKYFYKSIFTSHFPNCNNIIPDYWMPKYLNSLNDDPSARTLVF